MIVHCTDPAKDIFATDIRLIKPKCLAHTCVDPLKCLDVHNLGSRLGMGHTAAGP